jgi:dTMP kinase
MKMVMHNLAGKFITFEGGEGAGKSTQILRLAEILEDNNAPVLTTREPGGSPAAEQIRELILNSQSGAWDPISEALLMFAARREHVERKIMPALKSGKTVLCDRFSDSTMAYQGYAGGMGREAVNQLYKLVLGEFKPDLTIIFDLPVELSIKRRLDRGQSSDRFENKGIDFHQKLSAAFRDIAKREPQRCTLIDASMDVEKVTVAIVKIVEAQFDVTLKN